MTQWTPHPDTWKPVRYKGYFGPLLDGPGDIRAPEGRMQPPWKIQMGYMPELAVREVDERLEKLAIVPNETRDQRIARPRHYLWPEDPPEFDFLDCSYSERFKDLIVEMTAHPPEFVEVFHHRPNGELTKMRYFELKKGGLEDIETIPCVIREFSGGGYAGVASDGIPNASYDYPLLDASKVRGKHYFWASNSDGVRGGGTKRYVSDELVQEALRRGIGIKGYHQPPNCPDLEEFEFLVQGALLYEDGCWHGVYSTWRHSIKYKFMDMIKAEGGAP